MRPDLEGLLCLDPPIRWHIAASGFRHRATPERKRYYNNDGAQAGLRPLLLVLRLRARDKGPLSTGLDGLGLAEPGGPQHVVDPGRGRYKRPS